MPEERQTRTITMRPLMLAVVSVCLIGLSAGVTYFIGHTAYEQTCNQKDRELLDARNNAKTLSDANIELRSSIKELEAKYTEIDSKSKELAAKVEGAEQKNTQTAAQLASTLKELENSKADFARIKSDLDGKNSQIETISADRQAAEQKLQGMKQMVSPYLVLEPTWVAPGETTLALDGKLGIVLDDASATNIACKDSAASGHINAPRTKKLLCLRTGEPERFRYRGKKYLLDLIDSKESEGSQHYFISILKEP